MKEHYRAYPEYAACGLNCGLCPRYHTQGISRCPGCGGPGFYHKHPSCAIINCGQRHGGVEYCVLCGEFPCRRYMDEHPEDSFITYRNVTRDFETVKTGGIKAYQAGLDEKIGLLQWLLEYCNDGRRKNFYCLAVNLLELEDVKATVARIREQTVVEEGNVKERAARAVRLFEEMAGERGIELRLKNKNR